MGYWGEMGVGLGVGVEQGGGARVFRILGGAISPGTARWPFEASRATEVRHFLSPWCLKKMLLLCRCCGCADLGDIAGSRYFVSIKGKGACAGFQPLRKFCTVTVSRGMGS